MELTIKMNRDEMRKAIESGSLMALLEDGERQHCEEAVCKCQDTLAEVPQSVPTAAPVAVPNTPVQPAPAQQPDPAGAAAPLQQTAPAAPAAPIATTTMTYQLDDLAQAAMGLMQQGMQPQLQELLQQFGVIALPELPKGQYGAFATALRGMGAQI